MASFYVPVELILLIIKPYFHALSTKHEILRFFVTPDLGL